MFHEGDECHEFYMIVSGTIALEIEEPGHTLRVQTLGAGDELGWSALLMGSGKHFQARAGRLQSTRLQVHDRYSPVAKRAGT